MLCRAASEPIWTAPTIETNWGEEDDEEDEVLEESEVLLVAVTTW